MALQVSYTDKRGVANNEAYAKITRVTIDSVNQKATCVIMLYHNNISRSKADITQTKEPVLGVEYIIFGEAFTTYLAESVIKALDTSVFTQAYAWLKQHVDTGNVVESHDRMNHNYGINWTTATDV